MISQIAKQIKKIPFVRYGKWTTPLLMDAMISQAVSEQYLRQFRIKTSFSNYLVIDGEYYWDESEATSLKKKLRKLVDNKFLEKYIKFNKNKTNLASRKLKRFSVQDFAATTDKQLINDFKNWMQITKPLMHLNTILVLLDPVLEQETRKRLQELSIGRNTNQILMNLIQPIESSYLIKEHNDLLRLTIQIDKHPKLRKLFLRKNIEKIMVYLHKNHPRLLQAIETHKVKYCWLAVTDWWGPLYSTHHYIKGIKKLLQKKPQKTLSQTLAQKLQQEDRVLQELKTLGAPTDLRQLVRNTRRMLDLNLHQWDTVSISGYFARPMLLEIGRRLKLSYNEAIQLVPEEIEDCIVNNIIIPKDTIEKRLAHRAFCRLGSKKFTYAGEEAMTLGLTLRKKLHTTQTILGTPSYQGIATGKVKLVQTIREIKGMKVGQILVCPMTNPDYMPAVHKAAAIVTDEGGILCHAAIISREFEIPCIVGTK
ncbi:MAG: PEP-utilizing enzyme, partial [Candidatus Woesearchaeota archaeon]